MFPIVPGPQGCVQPINGLLGVLEPGLKVVEGQARASLEFPGFVLRYTVDGSEPTSNSPEVVGAMPASPQLRVAAFDTNGRKGHTAKLGAPR